MKHLFYAVMIVFWAIHASAQSVQYHISGIVSTSVKQLNVRINHAKDPVQAITVTDGKFSIQGEAEMNDIITLENVSDKGNASSLMIVNDGTPVEVDFFNHTIKGSDLNNAWGTTQQELFTLSSQCQKLLTEYYIKYGRKKKGETSDEQQKLEERCNALEKRFNDLCLDYFRNHKHDVSPATLFNGLFSFYSLSYEELSEILNPEVAYYNHPAATKARTFLTGLDNCRIGKTYTDLSMNDTEGKECKLSEWVGNGHYVLVDFWASWCGPCQREMPNVVAAYRKYHDKGFDVVGVSFDHTANDWKNAIRNIGMNWHNMSDLKGWGCAASEVYGIRRIPSNLLIDGNGKIIERDLRGGKLHEKLKELYGF